MTGTAAVLAAELAATITESKGAGVSEIGDLILVYEELLIEACPASTTVMLKIRQ